MKLNFWKMNGAGNDFVMLDNRDRTLALDQASIAHLCDRHRGIGADGLLMVEPAAGEADFRMRYFNADGGEADMCGNGARCFGRFVNHLHQNSLDGVSFETEAGVISAEFESELVRVNMSDPFDLKMHQELGVDGQPMIVHSVNTGVPHAIVVVEDLEDVPIRNWGAALRYHEAFAPGGTNANFVAVRAPGKIAIRTYERGVEDETLACGTGMVACALVHHELIGAESPVEVTVRGGDALRIGFEETSPHHYTNVTLFGPADFVFEGQTEL
jgi:diaminopimelate epimerase